MINLNALDRFARDHLQFEAKCSRRRRDPSFSVPPTDPEIICGLDEIRTLIMDGAILEACDVSEKLCSRPIDDPRVQLNVRIHTLHELIYTAENVPKEKKTAREEALEKALHYSRKLASFALDAFPEAYPMFTESMMLFACPERTNTVEAIRKRRKALADELVSLTRMTVGARESRLSFLIRYLLLIYIQFKSPVMTPGETFDPQKALITELLMGNRDSFHRTSRILWKTDGTRPTKFGHRDDYKEIDVQALPERVNISRQDSIESLRFSDGDVSIALKNELGRVEVSRTRFRQLVIEYCAARGFHVFEAGKTRLSKENGDQFPVVSDEDDRMVVVEGMVSQDYMEMFSTLQKLRGLAGNSDIEAYLPVVEEMGHELLEQAPVLDFRIGQCEVLKYLKGDEFDTALKVIQQRLAPAARKYPELQKSLTDTITLLVFATDVKRDLKESERAPNYRAHGGVGEDKKRNLLPEDTEMCGNNCDPGAEEQGKYSNSFEDFLSTAIRAVIDNVSIDSIIAEAYKAYEMKFKAPELLQMLSSLVVAHKEWQTYNMMTDRFSNTMGIDELGGLCEGQRGSSAFTISECANNQNVAEEAQGANPSSQISTRDQRRNEQRENTVLTLMEFLAISRAEALTVVRNHPNAENAQTILEHML